MLIKVDELDFILPLKRAAFPPLYYLREKMAMTTVPLQGKMEMEPPFRTAT